MTYIYETPANTVNFFLLKAKEEKTPLTQLKLMKLVYFAYGWVLATTNTKLFEEDIEAWKFGPVVPSVYHEFKHFGKSCINTLSIMYDWDRNEVETPMVDNKHISTMVLEKVWDVYKRFSANGLVKLTHQKGGPWDTVYKTDSYGDIIPDDNIREYFSHKIEEYLVDAA